MSQRPSTADSLGELGCTRDGYWLVAVAWALSFAFALPLLLFTGVETLVLDPGSSRIPGWAWTLSGLGDLGGRLLFLIGLGALAAFPLGPLPRWLKLLLAVYLILELAWIQTGALSRPENHPWLTGFHDLAEQHLIMRMPFPALASFHLGSLGFCLVRSLWLSALVWGLVAAHSLLLYLHPGYLAWLPAAWVWTAAVLRVAAPLLTALALGARIRATSRS